MDKSLEGTAPATVTVTVATADTAGALAASPRASASRADSVLENSATAKTATGAVPGELR